MNKTNVVARFVAAVWALGLLGWAVFGASSSSEEGVSEGAASPNTEGGAPREEAETPPAVREVSLLMRGRVEPETGLMFATKSGLLGPSQDDSYESPVWILGGPARHMIEALRVQGEAGLGDVLATHHEAFAACALSAWQANPAALGVVVTGWNLAADEPVRVRVFTDTIQTPVFGACIAAEIQKISFPTIRTGWFAYQWSLPAYRGPVEARP